MKRQPMVMAAMMTTVLAVASGDSAQATDALYLSHPDAVDGITVVDGSGKEYRIHGIAEPTQFRGCVAQDGKAVNCTELAARWLEQYASSFLNCVTINTASDPISVRCRDYQGRDVGARMVRTGWAVPDRATGQDYIFEEIEAEALGAGVWAARKTSAR
ncbi:MAG: hypothetical protein AAGG69_05260 [Pseudomonadota bacterium]